MFSDNTQPRTLLAGLLVVVAGYGWCFTLDAFSYIAVIVSSSITKSGSTISGDTIKIVIVQTDPGYAGNPGHAGTGKVVATLCG